MSHEILKAKNEISMVLRGRKSIAPIFFPFLTLGLFSQLRRIARPDSLSPSLILTPPYPPPPFPSNATWLLPLIPYRQDFDGNPPHFILLNLIMYIPGSL